MPAFTYRKALKTDGEVIKEFCKEHKVAEPERCEVCYLCEDSEGKLVGLAALKKVYMIEPVISGFPRATQVLAEKVMAVAGLATDEVVGLVKGESSSYIAVLEEYGFVVTDRHMTILKREV